MRGKTKLELMASNLKLIHTNLNRAREAAFQLEQLAIEFGGDVHAREAYLRTVLGTHAKVLAESIRQHTNDLDQAFDKFQEETR